MGHSEEKATKHTYTFSHMPKVNYSYSYLLL